MATLEKKQTLEEKLQEMVDYRCKDADEYGTSKMSTCKDSHYGWDADIWAHKGAIISAIQERGYGVSVDVNWGVTDIVITKQITLK